MQSAFAISIAPSEQLSTSDANGFSLVESLLQRGIRQHLESGNEWFRSADLSIRVTDCRFEGTYARVNVSVSGHVNDADLPQKEFAAEISAPVGSDTMATAAGGMAGAALQQAVDAAIEKLKSDNPTPHPDALDQKILFQLLEYLDHVVGRSTSPSGMRWNGIRRIRWIAGGAAFVVVMVLGLVRGGLSTNGAIAGLLFGTLAAPLAFLIVHCAGLFVMPASFFTTETAGKKAMLMAGVGSVGALKVAMIIAAIFLAACLVGDLVMVWESANWK
jgi:hypothetical protein